MVDETLTHYCALLLQQSNHICHSALHLFLGSLQQCVRSDPRLTLVGHWVIKPVVGRDVLAQIFAEFPEMVVRALRGMTRRPEQAYRRQDLLKIGEPGAEIPDAKVLTRLVGPYEARLAPAIKLSERPSKRSLGLLKLRKNYQSSISCRGSCCRSRIALGAKEQPNTHRYANHRTRTTHPVRNAARFHVHPLQCQPQRYPNFRGQFMPDHHPILVACEYSDTVASAFRAFGFDAYSCDLRPSEGDSRWHIQDDVRNHLQSGRWLAMVAHPYCTYNTLAGIRWMYHPDDTALPQPDRRRHPKYPSRMRDFLEGALLFADLMAAPVEFIAAENSKPHGLAMSVLGRPTQTVQPYNFGSPFTKGATLWLKNLPALVASHTKAQVIEQHGKIEARCHLMPPGPDREKERSRFDPAIAAAMAQQWGDHILRTRAATRTFVPLQLEQAA